MSNAQKKKKTPKGKDNVEEPTIIEEPIKVIEEIKTVIEEPKIVIEEPTA